MADGFDLRDEPWIPVRWANGASARCGLRELFHRAHEIVDVELPVPPAASGLLRILAAMTARIARDDDGVRLDDADAAEEIAAWLEVRDQVLAAGRFDPKAVDAYLDEEVPAGRFDLFDPVRPFLQDPRLATECVDAKGEANPSGVNKLVFGRPTGVNGAVLFGHFTDGEPVAVPAAEAAWHVIAQLYYGPAGQCTPRRITTVKPGNGDAGPLRKAVSYHAWAPDLFTSLVLAVPVPDEGLEAEAPDECPWETGDLPDPLAPLSELTWPGRLLTGRFRHAVLLVPSADRSQVRDAYITWSTHEPRHTARDPYTVLDRGKEGQLNVREADGARALWRDLDALLLMDGARPVLRPAALNDLPPHLRARLSVRAYGFHQDGQQKDTTWFEATTPPVLQWQEEADPRMARHLARCHQAAEEVGDRLDYAARLAWKLATDAGAASEAKVKLDRKKPGPWAGAALGRYWSAAEREFWQMADPDRCDTPPLPPLVNAALEALDGAIGPVNRADIRVARARTRARSAVRALLRAAA
ncbi:type I-E CRISPR-associated protein Cse1/CasA [Streptomyces ipomoeae]|uniref:type I-E CRISPR-associated protein Cse1/CasA n=1 Tax=Streptomyces ipomoeae TaxID=103232 RepID=UPI0029ADF8AE|nr:type I-E CRISPR-associated protein Cse1/CasA [Streptomyces ipomoeae]MDX2821574.1 type I-E CRISPR-associated protein Cse1/CasA [Streptomyces ipomoeae]MDX2879614.1 type I-E CRISPR-associated protein Cse1/CasA [Streptomyces ipomoeae]